MDAFSLIDWAAIFNPDAPLLEMVVRGSVIYWFLFLVFRFVVRRDVGSVGIADILILVIVADAAQNAMAGEYTSISDGIVLLSTLIGWNLLLDWLSYRFAIVRRFVEPSVVCLIRDGRLIKNNLRKEFITEEELWGKLRESGVNNLSEIKKAYLESDGQISVVKK